MSRSFKKTPVFGNADTSDKSGKVRSHRCERVLIKRLLRINRSNDDWDNFTLPHRNGISHCNVWDFPKDGKHYWSYHKAWIKGSEETWYRCMRK